MSPDGIVNASLLTVIILMVSWLREDVKALVARVGEHDSYITALKLQGIRGGLSK